MSADCARGVEQIRPRGESQGLVRAILAFRLPIYDLKASHDSRISEVDQLPHQLPASPKTMTGPKSARSARSSASASGSFVADEQLHFLAQLHRGCFNEMPVSPAEHSEELPPEITDKREVSKLGRWKFDAYAFERRHGNTLLHTGFTIGSELLTEAGISNFKVPLRGFLQDVQKQYHRIPYHNSIHAADVLSSCTYFLREDRRVSRAPLGNVSRLATFVAAVIHDVGHFGRTNRFHVASHDPVAVLYNDQSPLENMHCTIGFSILRQPHSSLFKIPSSTEDECSGLPDADFTLLRRIVIESVLATDMAKHFETLSRFKAAINYTESDALGSALGRIAQQRNPNETAKTLEAPIYAESVAGDLSWGVMVAATWSTKGYVVGWSTIANETPAPEGVVCNTLPAVVYVRNTKTLCAELLRGVGGLLLDRNGRRFTNELGTRQAVVNAELKADKAGLSLPQPSPHRAFALVLNSKAAKMAERHVTLYSKKGLLTKVEGVEGLAQHFGYEVDILKQSLRDYNDAAKSGSDVFGRTVFPDYTIEETEDFYVGEVVPVIHYTMGGIAINVEGQVLDKDQKTIPGLYAIGEASGGVHGDNRLAGNSLLECTVFGRHVGMALPIRTGSTASGAASGAVSAVSSPASEELRKITQEELLKHRADGDLWVALYGQVYDMTEYVWEHPGGSQAIFDVGGQDVTVTFEAVHNKELLETMGFQPVGVLA
ncbi:unnamed protein product [Cladocopium goreaui]|uniref:Phosphodiesterase n=1 Tax=Cladocopium goreaui TaxID=2562237 RepID=A0A9P1BMH3_9DINO|nr:unnamed protein product [Cladocopium goreaui]